MMRCSATAQTHNIALAGPIADFVVSLNTDGYILSQGSIKDAVSKDAALAEEMKHEEEAIELDENEETTMAQPADDKKGKLIVPEEIAIGHIGWDTCKSCGFLVDNNVDDGRFCSPAVHPWSWRKSPCALLGNVYRDQHHGAALRRDDDVVARLVDTPVRSRG